MGAAALEDPLDGISTHEPDDGPEYGRGKEEWDVRKGEDG